MSKNNKYEIDFRLWVYSDGEKLVGKGRIELLEKIQKTGSISKAAQEMKMSYRQAWQMVKEMNERANSPFVVKKLGGKEGGGATLTKEGENAIMKFNEINRKVQEFIQQLQFE